MRPILFDTCAALWVVTEGQLTAEAEAELMQAQRRQVPIYISPITAWEVGQLVARGRITLPMSPISWFDAHLAAGVSLAPLTPELLIEASFLPPSQLRDPADRILASTARALGLRLMTRDRPLLEFARAGHLQAIAC